MILTWLPLPSFKDSVRSLSDHHLGLQRYHVLHIVESLHTVEVSELPKSYHDSNPTEGLSGSLNMWQGYEMQLCEFGLEVCDEYSMRKGKRDKLYEPIARHLDWATSETSKMGKPDWFGDIDFHMSHQAALVREDPEYYRPQFLIDSSRQLIWPVADG